MDVGLIRRKQELCYISGEKLRQMREEKGLSQAQLSKALADAGEMEISQKQISRWESSFEFGCESELAETIERILTTKKI